MVLRRPSRSGSPNARSVPPRAPRSIRTSRRANAGAVSEVGSSTVLRQPRETTRQVTVEPASGTGDPVAAASLSTASPSEPSPASARTRCRSPSIDRDPCLQCGLRSFGLLRRLGHAGVGHRLLTARLLRTLALDRLRHSGCIGAGTHLAGGKRGLLGVRAHPLAGFPHRIRDRRLRIVDGLAGRVGRHRLACAGGIAEHCKEGHARRVHDAPLGVAERTHLGHDPLVEGAAHGVAAQPPGPRIANFAIGVDHVQQALGVPADLALGRALAPIRRRIAEPAQVIGRSRRVARYRARGRKACGGEYRHESGHRAAPEVAGAVVGHEFFDALR